MNKEENKLWIGSFDIGSINFSFTIEEIILNKFENIKNIQKNKRYNIDGTMTPEFENIIEQVYKNGKIILIKNINLKHNVTSKKDHDIFQNMIECLDEYKDEYFDLVDHIIVEKQMKINQRACRLSICCITYFMNNYGREKNIVEFDAYHKTTILGAVKNKKIFKNGKIKYTAVDKPTRKKWCVNTGMYILSLREDYETMCEISLMKKADDVMDNVCMTQAYKYLQFVDKFIF